MSDQRLSPMGIEDLVLQAIKAGATNQEEIRRRVGLKRAQIEKHRDKISDGAIKSIDSRSSFERWRDHEHLRRLETKYGITLP